MLKTVRIVVPCVTVLIIIGVLFFVFKKSDLDKAIDMYSDTNESALSIFQQFEKDNRFEMSESTRNAQNNYAKAMTDVRDATAEYKNSEANNPPWYCFWQNGVLWWDERNVTKRAMNDAILSEEKAAHEYEYLRSQDEVFNNSVRANMSLLDSIGAWMFGDFYTQSVFGISSGSHGITGKAIVAILIILFLILLFGVLKGTNKGIIEYVDDFRGSKHSGKKKKSDRWFKRKARKAKRKYKEQMQNIKEQKRREELKRRREDCTKKNVDSSKVKNRYCDFDDDSDGRSGELFKKVSVYVPESSPIDDDTVIHSHKFEEIIIEDI